MSESLQFGDEDDRRRPASRRGNRFPLWQRGKTFLFFWKGRALSAAGFAGPKRPKKIFAGFPPQNRLGLDDI
jgi:hypothetical protein